MTDIKVLNLLDDGDRELMKWDESKHKRAANGQFGSGGGESKGESTGYAAQRGYGGHGEAPKAERKERAKADAAEERARANYPVKAGGEGAKENKKEISHRMPDRDEFESDGEYEVAMEEYEEAGGHNRKPTAKEKKKDKVEKVSALDDRKAIIIVCSNYAFESLMHLLSYLKECGDRGHSVSIPVDDRVFGFDGDGADKIYDLEVGINLQSDPLPEPPENLQKPHPTWEMPE